MKKRFSIIFSTAILTVFFFNLGLAGATSTKSLKDAFPNLKNTASEASYNTNDNDGSLLATNINNIINIALSLLGVIFVVLTVYGGFLYMTARGNEEQTKKGQSIIVQALIGLIIVLSAYAISYFVFKFFI